MTKVIAAAQPSFAATLVQQAQAPAASSARSSHIAAPLTATRFLDRPEGRIAYDDVGSGPLVLMVPGLGDLRQEYRFLMPRLVAAGYRAVAIDIRGHGESSTGWRDHHSAALGSDVVALLRHLDAGPAVLVGTSMGAAAVAWAAAEAPALVGRLVLIGPFVRDIPPRNALAGLAGRAMIAALFAGPWRFAAWGKFYDSLYPSRLPPDHAAYRTALLTNLRQPGRFAALKAMIAASKADVAARLAEVVAPTLVVMGTADPDFADPTAEAGTVAWLLRGRTVMLPHAGHYPQAEMPDDTAAVILNFLAEAKR